MTAKRRRSIYLADDQWGALAELGVAQDRSVNAMVRQAVANYLTATRIVPPNQHSAGPDTSAQSLVPEQLGPHVRTTGEPVLPAVKAETRDPDDAEAAGLRAAFPHLKEPKIVDPNPVRPAPKPSEKKKR